jgi:ribosomal protein S12 methylthiotransferase
MPTQAPDIDGNVMINDFEGAAPAPGQMRRLRITEAHDYDLIGTLLAGGEEDSRVPAAPLNLINISFPNPLPAR